LVNIIVTPKQSTIKAKLFFQIKSSEIVFDKKVQVTEAKDDKPALNKIAKDSFFKKKKIF
jgi:hypothetical protein